ncbi:MAG: DegT/DnrJ/EryC1/StrS family aminotransferase, partial [Pseudomonadota bacterium]
MLTCRFIQRFCLACASGGYAIQLALRASGISTGDPVLTNGFTLSPVPGAIQAVGGIPVLVETTSDLVIDLKHLEHVIKTSGSKLLLLS